MKRAWIWIAGFVLAAIGVTAFVAVGSIGSSGPTRKTLAQWVRTTGLGQSIGTITADGDHIDEVLADHRGAGALHTDCSLLATDAGTASNNLPSPDDDVTELLQEAYVLEFQAGTACYHAGTTDAAELKKSAAKRSRAHGLFLEALAEIHSVTGMTVSTTTTTEPTTGSILG